MGSRYDKYVVRRGDDIGDPAYWNLRLRDVDTRLVAVEGQKDTLDTVIDEGRTVFRTRVDEILVPLVQEVEAIADLGALLRAHSGTEVEIAVGGKTLVVDEADRLRFAAPGYLTLMVAGDPSRAMSGALVSYDKATGDLVVDVDRVVGSGSAADWTISVANTTDAAADAAAARAARDATLGYRTQAEGFALSTAADAATSTLRAAQSVAAADASQVSKVAAQASASAAAAAASTAVGYLVGALGTHVSAPTARADGSALQAGDWYFRQVSGSPLRYFIDYWDGAGWRSLTAAADASVSSFSGRVGGVVPASGDYRADMVSRTSAQQAVVAGADVEAAIEAVAGLVSTEATARAAADAAKADKATTISGGGLISGGGDLSAGRTLTVTKSSQAAAVAGTDDTTAMTPARVSDAIAAQVPAASTTVVGRARLATTTEATTGTAADIAVTPAGLKAATSDLKDQLLNGAGAALDTLADLGAALGNDANFAATVSGQIAAKLDTSATSAWARGGLLSAADQTSARTYLGLGALALRSSGVFDYQVFTASGTWTKPANLPANALVRVEYWGGGGSGGYHTTYGGAGGGGGGYTEVTFRASDLGATETVIVGAGGAAVSVNGTAGNDGGNSTFHGVSGLGGKGGSAGTSTVAEGGAGGGGMGMAGVLNGSGGSSWRSIVPGWAAFGGGGGGEESKVEDATYRAGGSSFFGGGGGAGGVTSYSCAGGSSVLAGAGGDYAVGGVGQNGSAPAGGGSGGKATSSGAGARGEVRITVFG